MTPEERLRLGMEEYAREHVAKAPFVIRLYPCLGLGVTKLLGSAPTQDEPRRLVQFFDREGRGQFTETVRESELALDVEYPSCVEAYAALDRALAYLGKNYPHAAIKEAKLQIELIDNRFKHDVEIFVRNGCEPLGKDACEVCKGERGGMPGNENIVEGKVVCDYCTVDIMDARYTIDQLDEAIVAILGEHGVRRGDPSWARTHALLDAGFKAWKVKRPEDQHTRRIRAALDDVQRSGLQPTDGVFPDALED